MKPWQRTFILLSGSLVAGMILAALVLPSVLAALRKEGRILTTSTVLQQIQTLSQLVTVRYVIEKVVVLEDVKWYGESRVLLLAHGVVKAGVDLARLQPGDIQIDAATRNVTLRIPPVAITDVYLDEQRTRIIERTTGVLRGFDATLEQSARRQAVEDIRNAARNGGIYDEAAERARSQLAGLLKWMGFNEVRITIR